MIRTASTLELAFAVRTDTGMLRRRNEDAVAVNPECGIAVLADGMGGYNAGDVASRIAVATVRAWLEKQLPVVARAGRSGARQCRRALEEAVAQANRAICEAAQGNAHYSGMGTTLVTALFRHDKAVIAHVGDSRLYRWRDGGLRLLTRDHSLIQEQIDAGLIDPELARYSPRASLITRALGVTQRIETEMSEHALGSGDIYLLCSDGLSDMLAADDIAGLLERHGDDLEEAADALVRQANANGGRDNISIVLVRIKSVPAALSGGWLARLPRWMR
ncbi:MAG TPA: Stp1/IreP family PP2C-type Ser/Thr phosphatase [Paucimonas sp.]|nr:Stp1/IreP family PP2C-type Ser/Thr phosphatase [Paucimonas sp.]